MVSRLEVAKHGRSDCRHARGGGAGVLRAFESGHALFEHPHRRVGKAAIDEARLLVLEAALGGFHRVVDIARGEEQRLARLAKRRAVRAAMNGFGPGPQCAAVACRLAHRATPNKKPRPSGSGLASRPF